MLITKMVPICKEITYIFFVILQKIFSVKIHHINKEKNYFHSIRITTNYYAIFAIFTKKTKINF